jgi:RsiW-degrading membrane proteinase PrsW (M82 family)
VILAVLAASAIIPSLLLLWYFQSHDLKPEPARVVWATFFLGVAVIPGVLLLDWPFQALLVSRIEEPHLAGLGAAFFTAAIPEELFKLIVVRGYSARHREFDEPMDGIVYGVAASLGFATLENVLYVGQGGIGVAVMRAITAVPGHAFFGAVMGYFVGQSRFAATGRARAAVLAYVVPVILHGLYDFPLLTLQNFTEKPPGAELALLAGLAFGTLVVAGVTARRLVKRLKAEQQAGLVVVAAGVAAAAAVPGSPGAMVGVGAVAAAAFPVPAAALAPAPAPGGKILGGFLVLLGGILATGGALVIVAIVAGFATGGVSDEQRNAVIGGTVIIGVLPFGLGVSLFRRGLRRLGRTAASALPAPAAPLGSA